MGKACPFCALPPDRIVSEHGPVVVVRDRFPVSSGHSLVVPRRHVGSFFETTEEEQRAILKALTEAKAALEVEFAPAGYNIGINDGAAAGQTVSHLHIHLIPRFDGDQEDPRGGVRWIFPEKAQYWAD